MSAEENEIERLTKSCNEIKCLNPFWVLGVEARADGGIIKQRYRKMSLELHPDKNAGTEKSQDAFAIVNKAFSKLTKPDSKRQVESVVKEAEARLEDKRETAEANPERYERLLQEQISLIFVELEEKRKRIELREQEERKRHREAAIERSQALATEASEAKRWEEGREQRVHNWKEYSSKKKRSRRY